MLCFEGSDLRYSIKYYLTTNTSPIYLIKLSIKTTMHYHWNYLLIVAASKSARMRPCRHHNVLKSQSTGGSYAQCNTGQESMIKLLEFK